MIAPRPPRRGVDPLLIAYAAVFVLVAGIVAVVLLPREQPAGWIEIKPQAVNIPPNASPAKPVAPPTIAIAPAPVAPPPTPVASPAPSPAPAPPPAPSPGIASASPAVPAGAPAAPPAEPQSAMAPVGPNGYPPPPPEKPAPTKPAAPPAVATTAPAPVPSSPSVASAPPAPTPAIASATPPAAIPPATGGAFDEKGPYGPLPHIGADGRLPWIVNDARFDHRTRVPRIAVLVVGLGFDAKTTEDAIVKLPPEISLGFLPYAENLDRWTKLARDFGHEVLLSLPMDSGDAVSQQILGPRMLSPKLGAAENIDRLRWILSRANNYIGLVTWEGQAFLNDPAAVRPVLQEISGRGLMLVDARMAKPNTIQDQADGMGLPFAKSRGFIDEPRDAESVDANLLRLEELARKSNFAMAMAVAFPVSIERLVNWSHTVTQRGFVLAPVTGVTQCTELCQARVRRHAAAVQALKKDQ